MFLIGPLPSPKETVKGNIKTITEYKIDEDGKKLKVSSVFISFVKCFRIMCLWDFFFFPL